MKPFLYCLILFHAVWSYSQTKNSDVIGKWHITEAKLGTKTSYCWDGVTDSEIETRLNKDYIGASIEFLNTQELIYRDKNNKGENEKDSKPFIGLDNYKWRLIDKEKIELIELLNNKVSKGIKIQYSRKKIQFNFIGIIFILEKTNNT